MVTGGRDMALWVGDLNPETWVSAACNLAGRNMCLEEWDAFPEADTCTRHCEQSLRAREPPTVQTHGPSSSQASTREPSADQSRLCTEPMPLETALRSGAPQRPVGDVRPTRARDSPTTAG